MKLLYILLGALVLFLVLESGSVFATDCTNVSVINGQITNMGNCSHLFVNSTRNDSKMVVISFILFLVCACIPIILGLFLD